MRSLGVRVPLRSRHFLSQKLWHFPKNTRPYVENEWFCPRTVNISNVNFTSKICMLGLNLSHVIKMGLWTMEQRYWYDQIIKTNSNLSVKYLTLPKPHCLTIYTVRGKPDPIYVHIFCRQSTCIMMTSFMRLWFLRLIELTLPYKIQWYLHIHI